MRILVIGGTRFFGKRLVHRLIEEGHEITVASRGNTEDDFGDKVSRVQVDRTDFQALHSAFGNSHFDVVYDQVGFNPKQMKDAVEVFGNRVKRYVFTSSISVYEGKEGLTTEADFNATTHPIDLSASEYEYGEGKRQAEAYLFQHAPFEVVAVRVGMVVSGDDDYTGRFAFHVNHVAEEKSISVLREPHPISYVTAWDVANLLYHLGMETNFVGPVNAVNDGYEHTQGLCARIGQILGKTPLFHEVDAITEDTPDYSPYAFPVTLTVTNDVAKGLGYQFGNWLDHLETMVQQVRNLQVVTED